MPETIGLAQARRIALAAQGFTSRSPAAAPTAHAVAKTVERMRLLQIDSVNVWERSHYMPVYSRLGGYDKRRLDQLCGGHSPRLVECWAHEASFLPVEDLPLFAFRRDRMRKRQERLHPDFLRETAELRARLMAEIAARGPLRASEIEHEERRRSGTWGNWSTVKRCLEFLFLSGELAAAPRIGFERRYGLPEQLLPEGIARAGVPEREAVRELVRRAAIAHGLGTVHDLADYFRLPVTATRQAIRELSDAGELLPVEVAGWSARDKPLPAWIHRSAATPRRVERTALLSPFDPLVWHRDRALRLHGFHYRIEIYIPAARRRYGYYSLPVLDGDRLCARVDLKNDRAARVLRVRSAWLESHARADAPARIAAELRRAAAWQELPEISVENRGDLAGALAAELRVTPLPPG